MSKLAKLICTIAGLAVSESVFAGNITVFVDDYYLVAEDFSQRPILMLTDSQIQDIRETLDSGKHSFVDYNGGKLEIVSLSMKDGIIVVFSIDNKAIVTEIIHEMN